MSKSRGANLPAGAWSVSNHLAPVGQLEIMRALRVKTDAIDFLERLPVYRFGLVGRTKNSPGFYFSTSIRSPPTNYATKNVGIRSIRGSQLEVKGFRRLCRIDKDFSTPYARTPSPFPFSVRHHYCATGVVKMASIEKINTPENIEFPNVLSHAVKIPGLVFCSGQVISLISGGNYLMPYGGCSGTVYERGQAR